MDRDEHGDSPDQLNAAKGFFNAFVFMGILVIVLLECFGVIDIIP